MQGLRPCWSRERLCRQKLLVPVLVSGQPPSQAKTVLPTAPGLEPEIQKLIAKHKQDIKKLKMLHEAELLQSDERAAQRYGQQAEELRDLLEREKEEQSQRERERARQRCGCAARWGLGRTACAAAFLIFAAINIRGEQLLPLRQPSGEMLGGQA